MQLNENHDRLTLAMQCVKNYVHTFLPSMLFGRKAALHDGMMIVAILKLISFSLYVKMASCKCSANFVKLGHLPTV